MKRLGFILGCAFFLGVAGTAFAQVGHVTPVGHVDSVNLDWRTPNPSEVQLPEGDFDFLSEDLAPKNTDQLGNLQLPEDKTYTLTLLGGIEASKGLSLGETGALKVQMLESIEGSLNMDGQNVLLLYNNVTGKWDGISESSFDIEDGSSYDIQSQYPEIRVRLIGAKATEVTTGGGGGGGGCSAAFLAPAALFLLAPLLVLRKRG